ncbi:type VI secretion system tube protein TssD [Niabella aurantiaca]|uniref:type VI secretion system tube protein TssD n=1 Tax=Niabella aurantiaca TaxID=379900 RepID=UPI00037A03BA|nr:type VI secretion system tube protein TssD [Niabella aurantiaca]
MSFYAILKISGKTYNVLSAAYDFKKSADQYGKPKVGTDGGLISLTVESSLDTMFIKWMFSPTMTQEGEIIFMKRDTKAAMRRVQFSNGYCLHYSETFTGSGENPMTIGLLISCSKIEIDGEVFDKSRFWGNTGAGASGSGAPAGADSSASGGNVHSFIPD